MREFQAKKKEAAQKHKPRKLIQRTLYSQVEDMKDKVDADIRSNYSEPVKIFKGRKKQSIKDPFY